MNQLLKSALLGCITPTMMTCSSPAADAAKWHHWELGVGSYGAAAGAEDTWSGCTDLDRARMDWVFVMLGSHNTTGKELNRLLRLNPRLKILVRLWPIGNLGQKENKYQATFLDYLYADGVKGKLLQETSRQIHSILDPIEKPANVVGFTFLEELPMHFTGEELTSTDPDKLPWAIQHYQKQIEAERGKPLRWDADARRWWGQKFAQVLNEIHAHIKKESGGKLVFVYIQTNHDMLDYYPRGQDLNRSDLLPLHYADLIKPGIADGFFAYPNNELIWKRSMDIATKNNWPFFSQLAHPGGMRLTRSWEEAVRLASVKLPQNLGYFFYCDGNCRRRAFNDDPAIPDDDNFHPASIPSHFRRFTAQHNVGIEIVTRNLVPTMQLAYNTESAKRDDWVSFNLLVHNVRNASWHLKPEDLTLKRVRVTIQPPGDLPLPPENSFPATVTLGDIEADQVMNIMWWARAKEAVRIGKDKPVRVILEADNCPRVELTKDTASSVIEPPPFHEVRRSGERWVWPAYHLKSNDQLPTTIALHCIRDTATNPAITIDNAKIIWQGCVTNGQTLVIGPGRKALLKDAASPDGRDVSDRLGGRTVGIEGYRINYVSYHDDDVPSASAKLKITIEPQMPQK